LPVKKKAKRGEQLMIYYKTEEEIEQIRESSLLVAKTLAEVAKYMLPGVTTLELDNIAYTFINDHGAIPGFLNYRDYPYTLCISVNSAVVHGLPGKYTLKEGDIVSVDCGVLYKGFYGDCAYTFAIGDVSEESRHLLKVTKECLLKGIEMAVVGKRLGDVSYIIQENAEKNGCSVVRELVGHGIGKKLHEDPEVPNYGKRGKGPLLQKGLVIAIEPMINLGKKDVVQDNDGWTVRTADGKPSAHFEHTVAVGNGKADILTTFKYIEEALKIEVAV
jgi:methionyl aminopeptidase